MSLLTNFRLILFRSLIPAMSFVSLFMVSHSLIASKVSPAGQFDEAMSRALKIAVANSEYYGKLVQLVGKALAKDEIPTGYSLEDVCELFTEECSGCVSEYGEAEKKETEKNAKAWIEGISEQCELWQECVKTTSESWKKWKAQHYVEFNNSLNALYKKMFEESENREIDIAKLSKISQLLGGKKPFFQYLIGCAEVKKHYCNLFLEAINDHCKDEEYFGSAKNPLKERQRCLSFVLPTWVNLAKEELVLVEKRLIEPRGKEVFIQLESGWRISAPLGTEITLQRNKEAVRLEKFANLRVSYYSPAVNFQFPSGFVTSCPLLPPSSFLKCDNACGVVELAEKMIKNINSEFNEAAEQVRTSITSRLEETNAEQVSKAPRKKKPRRRKKKGVPNNSWGRKLIYNPLVKKGQRDSAFSEENQECFKKIFAVDGAEKSISWEEVYALLEKIIKTRGDGGVIDNILGNGVATLFAIGDHHILVHGSKRWGDTLYPNQIVSLVTGLRRIGVIPPNSAKDN